MIEFPPSALSLAGFVLAHAVWNVSDTADDELFCPLAVVEQSGGERRLLRFEAETQEAAIAAGKSAMSEAAASAAAWAFAREGTWRPVGASEPQDVLTIDFWARGMRGAASLVQPFERYTRGGRFHLLGDPVLVVEGLLVEQDTARASLEAIGAGAMTHAKAADLWESWL